MDDQQLGVRLRAARIRRGWRQADLAGRAGVSDATVSRIERGHLGSLTFEAVRCVTAALEIRLETLPRSRAGDLDRLVNARHAALAEAVLARFARLPGWVARPEISFNVYGDRGVVDVLAWHAASRSLLVIELKTEIVELGELLAVLDRKRRLGAAIGAPLGWVPDLVGTWLIVAEGRTNRRRLTAHRAILRAAFPDDLRHVGSWLREPRGELRAMSRWPNRHPGTARSAFATPRRVRRATGGRAEHESGR